MPTAAEQAVIVEGSAPIGSGSRDAVQAWLFQPDAEPTAVPLADVPRLVSRDDNLVWVELTGYTEPDLRDVASLLGLETAAVRAAFAPWRRPRLVTFGAHAYVSVTVTRLEPAAHRVEARQLDLFIGTNFLVSAQKLPLPFADHLRRRARNSPDLVRLDSGFLLYMVLDELLGYVDGLSEHLNDEILAMEERALRDASDTFLEDLLGLKRYVFAARRLAEQHREVFATFLRPEWRLGADAEVRSYFQDLQTRLDRLLDRMAAAKESVNGAFDIYVSQMAHRTNNVMRILTVVSTMLLPATLIVGLFATSFEGVSLYGRRDFIVMVVAILSLPAAILLAFRRHYRR